MFGQPRCREWTPLATQQLRLRNLIQIVGYNIQDGGSLYYTLHSTTMSAPFYTSEKLLSNHPKWREIDSELIHKMSSLNVVVRVWCHMRRDSQSENSISEMKHHQTDTIVQTWGVNFSGLLHIGATLALDFTPHSFKANTLVFQMIGGYFCSYESLRLEPAVHTNFEHPGGIAIMGKEASPSRKIPIQTKLYKSETKSVSPSRGFKNEVFESRCVSKSHSPPTGCFRQNFASAKTPSINVSNRHDSYARNIQDSRRERKRSESYSNSIYEHSPKSDTDIEIREYLASDESSSVLKSGGSLSSSSRDLIRMDIEESETAEIFEHTKSDPVQKCRYSSLKFLKSEIRPSYTADKLQKLHLLQYSIKKRSQLVQDIKERIYQKSAMENCENLSPHCSLVDDEDFSRSEKLSMSSREFSFFTAKNRHSSRSKDLGKLFSESKTDLSKADGMADSKSLPPDKDKFANDKKQTVDPNKPSDRRFTLPLNKLLEFKSQPSPSQRLRHSQLTRVAEVSRFKRRLLQDERDASLARLRKLRMERAKLFEENQDTAGTELMQKYHSLSRKAEQLKELRKSEAALRELCLRSHVLLQARRWQLVADIQLVYPIEEEPAGCLSILGVELPASGGARDGLRRCAEASLAVALGRAAHAAALAASLLGAPLRHAVRLGGSRSKVLDQLARHGGEIPLFARNKDSMLFRYGLYLLNRNIAQLLWTSQRVMTPDPGDTLGNLRRLLTPPTTSLDAWKMFGSASSMETVANSGWSPSPLGQAAGGTSSQSLRTMVPRLHSTMGRPFNRFKSLQSLEMSPTSAMGSEPSLHHFISQASDALKSETKQSNPEGENLQNILSFSESDLTKVTDIISPESISSTVDYSSISDAKVAFSMGEDTNTLEESMHEGRILKILSKEVDSDASIVTQKPCKEISDDIEAGAVNTELGKLREEVKSLWKNCDERNKIDCEECSCSDVAKHLDFLNISDDTNVKHSSSKNVEENSVCLDTIVDENDCVDAKDDVDIEKLGYPPFCNHPCSIKCPRMTENCPQMLHTGYDQCDNGDEIMHDVIVLPSAEAILTASSHFTDSPALFDDENVKQGLELRTAVLHSLQHQDSQYQDDQSNEELVNLATDALKLEDEESNLEFDAIVSENETFSQIEVQFSSIKDKGQKCDIKTKNNTNLNLCKNVQNGTVIPSENPCFFSESSCSSENGRSGCNIRNISTAASSNNAFDSANECLSDISVESSKECHENLDFSSTNDELSASDAILNTEINKRDASNELSVNGYS